MTMGPQRKVSSKKPFDWLWGHISLRLGSDAAIEADDVVLMTDEPSKLAAAIKIARRTRGIV